MFILDFSGVFTLGKYLNMYTVLILIVAIIFCGIFQTFIQSGKYQAQINSEYIGTRDIIVCMLILLFSGILIVCDTYNPFIYFQF